jgi:hypothetical protein
MVKHITIVQPVPLLRRELGYTVRKRFPSHLVTLVESLDAAALVHAMSPTQLLLVTRENSLGELEACLPAMRRQAPDLALLWYSEAELSDEIKAVLQRLNAVPVNAQTLAAAMEPLLGVPP